MPFIPVPNCAEVVLQGTMNGAAAYITLGLRKATPFAVGDLHAASLLVGQWWDEELSPLVCDHWLMPQMKLTSLESDSAPTIDYSGFSEHSGQVVTEAATDNVAMVIKFLTDSRGRSYRGRNYVPAIPKVAYATLSTWDATYLGNVVLAYRELPTILAVGDLEHVVISRATDNAPRVTGVSTFVTGYTGATPFGTQRRRILGTGA